MNLFFAALIVSFSAVAGVRECKQFVEQNLKPAISFDDKAEDHGYRFVKQESSALDYIKKYEISKLEIPSEVKKAKQESIDCKLLMDPQSKQEYCPSLFENFNFLRGLLHGMKHNGWSKETVELGKQRVFDYIKMTTTPDIQLIHLALSYSLLEMYYTEFPHKNFDLKKLSKSRVELEKASKELQKNSKKFDSKNCSDIQFAMKEELKAAEVFRAQLVSFLK